MKKIISLITVLVTLIFYTANLQAQEPGTDTTRMQWFGDAKLGIFIHWGIYAVNGISESWSFHNEQISYEDYMKQLNGFTAKNYNPAGWVKLIKESGAKYSVITSKHHDGVALWNSKYNKLNVVTKTPAGRDLLKPFVKKLRKANIKVGLYYSLLDWSDTNYPNFTRNSKRYDNNADTIRWQKFVESNIGQISELMDNYHPDLLWFDGGWEQSAGKWNAARIRKLLLEKNPEIIINSRLPGYGDYATPEQGLPVKRPKAKYWELCMTTNNSWGYQPNDKDYKSPYEIIRIFADVISMGGNLLLDIGPKADGTIPREQVHILKELGKWTKKHKKAIFATKAGIPPNYFEGPSTLSKDGKILYLFLTGKPNGPVMIKGLKNKVRSIWVVGNGTYLNHTIKLKAWWSKVPGIIFIDVPGNVIDKYITVLAVSLDKPVELYDYEQH
jgi:alpha-L-fucosidase